MRMEEMEPVALLVNVKTSGSRVPYVYIGRPSKWGNPFPIGKYGTREEVIEKYREWIKTQPQLLNDIEELRGKVLGCFCYPLPCHGDVLIGLLKDDRPPL